MVSARSKQREAVAITGHVPVRGQSAWRGDAPVLTDAGLYVSVPLVRRLLAYSLDQAMLIVVTVAAALAAGMPADVLLNTGTDPAQQTQGVQALAFGGLALAFGYGWLSVATMGGTVGMRLLGMQVVMTGTGRWPNYAVAAARAVVFLLIVSVAAAVTLGPGALALALTPLLDRTARLRAWHDKAVGTVLVRR